MNILILGATGFISSVVAARLVADGHAVTGLGRNPAKSRLKQPAIDWRRADLAQMTKPEDWEDLLKDRHAIVNCAGALQDGLSDDLSATQADAMLALYAAAKRSRPLIVQISARTTGAAADLPFLSTKRLADEALVASDLPHLILRPALVLGRNAHGGSSLLRALAAFPLALPLVHAESPVETLSVDDVAQAVSWAVAGELRGDIVLAADEALTLADLVRLHRQWLGLPPARVFSLAPSLTKPVTWLADMAGRLGWRSPLRSTAMTVMSEGIRSAKRESGLVATSAAATLAANPSGVQDLWFARLYLLKPLVIAGLSAFWLLSGLIPLLSVERAAAHFLPFMPEAASTALTLTTCLVDMALGAAVLVRPLAKRALLGMLAVSLAYLTGGTLLEPALWLDPLGPLVKVLPSIVLTLTALATLDER
ncbi:MULTISPECIES: SDR family oxidoreductase [Rhizobium]|uniref:NAD-dependent nucleoside-diphosphate-sugar epimerase protein n=1 Tax=Rhizobium phaseoli TaxID=396 RepID=A0A192TCC5_9HYPH|nr:MULTISPECIES: SDR family oxidoreductase [Rhizobium]ANL41275.1 NAD-dependent nucleoside-diphosphate-sugar epimerase protein [Rhizobium phaseoli]ANL54010.1 NAD-dependent nucleoside-diphosphate-sugar epimerase protein [Rhizobium phaseoli]ANL60263.1 NAD-dependent nucleoside-diphosphate-sugar epimerase protein [Rhizobium phaseoli]ANL85656.1 NAD-dependent nucleoside-diphosphate-sugar epimerase protein [Rhizobium phaseoli]ANL92165.1 NAD-dependent nucleoside-diphosphate-sugar epimerase protein [Rhi